MTLNEGYYSVRDKKGREGGREGKSQFSLVYSGVFFLFKSAEILTMS